MAIRMSEYYLLLLARYTCPIQQVVLYVANRECGMSPVLEHGPPRFSYSLRDIRECPALNLWDSSRRHSAQAQLPGLDLARDGRQGGHGKEDTATAVPKSLDVLRKAFS